MRIDRTGLSITLAVHALALYGVLHQPPIQRKFAEVAPLIVRIIAPPAPEHVQPVPPKPTLHKQSVPTLQLPPIAIASPAPPRPLVLPAASPPVTPASPRLEARVERETPVASITPPVFNANYLDNPAPAYPAPSRRMREQGRVILRVLVRTNGTPAQVQVRTSSGHARLDNAARDAVLHWRFVPAKRGAEPIEEWVLIPVSFRLDS
jgi:periplasmic protein TonB